GRWRRGRPGGGRRRAGAGRPAAPPGGGRLPRSAPAGEHVRLALRGADNGWEVLEGVLRSADGSALGLTHPQLGDLAVPWAACRELGGGFVGRRFVLEDGPRPPGERRSWPVHLESAPPTAWLTVQADLLSGKGEAALNGQAAGPLTHDPEPRSLRLELPGGLWRAGENTLELRPGPGAEGVIDRVAVEVPEAP